MKNRKAPFSAYVTRIIFWLILLVFIMPILWILMLSFRPLSVIMKGVPGFLQGGFTFEHYSFALKDTLFLRWMLNSTIVSVVSTSVCMVLGIFAGYVLGRLVSGVIQTIIIILLLAQVFPPPLLTIPMYLLMHITHITNPYIKVIIAHISFTLPLSTWLISNYIRQISSELEEAARIDGATWGQVLILIIVPIISPGIVAASVFTFLTSWGDFIWGLLFTNNEEHFLLSVGIHQFSTDIAAIQWGILLSMGVLYTLPVMAFFSFMQRRMIKGLASGALKG